MDRFLDALRPGIASGLDRLGLTEKFEASSLTDRLNDLIPRPRRSGAGEPALAKKETDNAIYSTFITHHTPANSKFPFPYLTPEDFDAALTDLVLSIRPERAVPTSAVKIVVGSGQQRRRGDPVGGILLRREGTQGDLRGDGRQTSREEKSGGGGKILRAKNIRGARKIPGAMTTRETSNAFESIVP